MSDTPSPVFVPFHAAPRAGKASARVGWIIAENGCHIWQGARTERGYGLVSLDGQNRRAHRVRYEMEVGPIPDGMYLDHFVCENPPCCNPAHVRPASHRENTLRGAGHTAKNAAKTHCPKGHPYEGDNVYVEPSTGGRQCRVCRRDRESKRPHRVRVRVRRRAALATPTPSEDRPDAR